MSKYRIPSKHTLEELFRRVRALEKRSRVTSSVTIPTYEVGALPPVIPGQVFYGDDNNLHVVTPDGNNFITPGASDGTPPPSSPFPTVRGGLGFLYITWDAVSNADIVTYEVHVSDTGGFTPGPTTLVGETKGTRTVVRYLQDGSLLSYYLADGATPKDYFVKIIARDKDGSASASAEGSGAMDPVGALDILAGSVTAEKLEAVLVLASQIIIGSPTLAGITMDVDEVAMRDSLGTTTFRMDGQSGDFFSLGQYQFGKGSTIGTSKEDFIDMLEQPSGFQQVAPVQSSAGSGYQSGGFSSAQRNFSTPSAIGSFLLLEVTTFKSSGTPTATTTPAGWTSIKNTTNGSLRLQVFIRENAPSISSQAVSFPGPTLPTHITVGLHEFSGVALSATQDLNAENLWAADVTTTVSSSPTSSALADELGVAIVSFKESSSLVPAFDTVTSGWSSRSIVTANSNPSGVGDIIGAGLFWHRETSLGVKSFTASFANLVNTVDYGASVLLTFKAKAASVSVPSANHFRAFARRLSGNSYPHIVNENGIDASLMLGKAGEVWKCEIVTASVNFASLAAHGGTSVAVSITGLNVGDYCFYIGQDQSDQNARGNTTRPPVCTTAGQITLQTYNADTAANDPGASNLYFFVAHKIT